eukprot:Phypoly_transcript_21245.p1 GENE.Phypoly_transcript_21245~~Phypoly_transcript_21245.p1  ORF type:complete len:155 (+),score=29.99 Phypoly_transcript_21245:142-606(+)
MAFVEEPAAFFLRATDVFKHFDLNSDGFLTVKELKAAVAAMCGERLTKQDIAEVLELDVAIGVSFEQFVNLCKSKVLIRSDETDIITAFKCFDKTRKGFITPLDVKKVFALLFKQMPEETIEQIFEELNVSEKSEITFDRFWQIMVSKVSLFVL